MSTKNTTTTQPAPKSTPPTTTEEKSDKRKQSLYFPEAMLQEIKEEAARQDRSLSWIVQRAWKIARTQIQSLPGVNETKDEEGK